MIDLNKPVTNPSLVRAIEELANGHTPEREATLVNELLAAHLIVPVVFSKLPEPSGEDGKATIKKGTTISFQMITNPENENFFQAFTDWDELRKWANTPNQQTLISTFSELGQMALRDTASCHGLVINPFGHNFVFNHQRIEAVLRANNQATPHVVEKETRVLLGQPKEYPKALTDAVGEHCRGKNNIKAAYLLLMMKEEPQEQSFLLVVDFTGDRQAVFDGIAAAARPFLRPDQLLDMVPSDDSFGQSAIQKVKPFYQRKFLGLF